MPNDPTVKDEVKQPPFYMSLQMPDQQKPAFQLTSSFIPQVVNGAARNVMYGFLAADSDAGNQKGVKADSYGQLRLLQIPPETQVPGPGQAQNKFNSDPTVSQALNLLRQGASAGAQRQPADAARGWRHALRAAGVPPVHGRNLVPHAPAGAGGVR